MTIKRQMWDSRGRRTETWGQHPADTQTHIHLSVLTFMRKPTTWIHLFTWISCCSDKTGHERISTRQEPNFSENQTVRRSKSQTNHKKCHWLILHVRHVYLWAFTCSFLWSAARQSRFSGFLSGWDLSRRPETSPRSSLQRRCRCPQQWLWLQKQSGND